MKKIRRLLQRVRHKIARWTRAVHIAVAEKHRQWKKARHARQEAERLHKQDHEPRAIKAERRADYHQAAALRWEHRIAWIEAKLGYLNSAENVKQEWIRKWVKAHPSRVFRMGGWGGQGSAWMQRIDQGQDFEIPINNWITSPGHATIISHASDRGFPNGFGSPYAIVQVHDGPFATGNGQWYVGHCNAAVRAVGTQLKPGDPIARANNSLTSGRGWCELGKWDGGPHYMGYGANFHHLFVDVRLPR